MNKTSNQKYLLTEKISTLFLRYFINSTSTLIIWSLCGLIGIIFLGQSDSDTSSMAAVTFISPIYLFICGFALIPTFGGNTIGAIMYGKGNKKGMEKCLGNAITSIFILSIIMIVISLFAIDPILTILNTPEAIYDECKIFARILCFGYFFLNTGNGLTSFLSTAGKPNYALFQSMISLVICSVFSYIFIIQFQMGVAGLAYAVIISESINTIFALRFFIFSKQAPFKIRLKCLILDMSIVKKTIKNGFTVFYTNFTNIIIMIVINLAATYYGNMSSIGASDSLAIVGIAHNIVVFILSPITGIALGTSPLIGCNYGANKYSRIIQILRISYVVSISIGVFFIIVIFSFSYDISCMFGIGDNLVPYLEDAIKISVLSWPAVGFYIIANNYYRAIGRPWTYSLLETIRQFLIVLPLYFVIPDFLINNGLVQQEVLGVIAIAPISDYLYSIIAIIFAINTFKKLRKSNNLEKKC